MDERTRVIGRAKTVLVFDSKKAVISEIALFGLIYHSITWFNLAPKAIVVKIGKHRVPDILIMLSNYIGWLVISVIIGWFLI